MLDEVQGRKEGRWEGGGREETRRERKRENIKMKKLSPGLWWEVGREIRLKYPFKS